jgi:hypothetical protein
VRDLAVNAARDGMMWLIHTFIRRHAEPQITVIDAFWA